MRLILQNANLTGLIARGKEIEKEKEKTPIGGSTAKLRSEGQKIENDFYRQWRQEFSTLYKSWYDIRKKTEQDFIKERKDLEKRLDELDKKEDIEFKKRTAPIERKMDELYNLLDRYYDDVGLSKYIKEDFVRGFDWQ